MNCRLVLTGALCGPWCSCSRAASRRELRSHVPPAEPVHASIAATPRPPTLASSSPDAPSYKPFGEFAACRPPAGHPRLLQRMV